MDTARNYKIILKKSLSDVEEVQKEFPQIGYEWYRGMSQRKIAGEYGVADRFSVSENLASMIVRWAIMGIDEDLDVRGVRGLVRRDLYDLVAKNRRETNIVRYNRRVGNKGFGLLDENTLANVSRKGVLRRGGVPFSDEEKRDLYALSLMKRFHGDKGVSWKDIVFVTNRRYGVYRNPKSVRDITYKYKKKNNL